MGLTGQISRTRANSAIKLYHRTSDINQALDDAQAGDHLTLQPGNYREHSFSVPPSVYMTLLPGADIDYTKVSGATANMIDLNKLNEIIGSSEWTAHIIDLNNPHNVTHEQVGNDWPLWNANKIQNIDVDLTGLQDESFLVYDSPTNQFEVRTISNFGGQALSDLQDDVDTLETTVNNHISDYNTLLSNFNSHTDNSDIHAELNDTVTVTDKLWSSQKIQNELDSLQITSSQVTDFDTAVSGVSNVSLNTSSRHDQGTDQELDSGGPNQTSAAEIRDFIDNNSLPIGTLGQAFFVNQQNTSSTETAHVITNAYIVETQDELDAARGVLDSPNTIFTSWYKFSHEGTDIEVDPIVDESSTSHSLISTWAWDGQYFLMNHNSAVFTGFVSDETYDVYTHETTLKSDENDNDAIAVLIAFHDDGSDEYTLSVVRTCGGAWDTNPYQSTQNHYAVWYNYGRDDAQIIADGASLISYAGQDWSQYPTGTRVRIERDGDIIKVYTSQMNSTTIVSGSELEIDLTSDPLLSVFRGKRSIGYGCWSQEGATFHDTLFLGSGIDKVYDTLDGDDRKVWTYDGSSGSWSVDSGIDFYDDLGIGRIAYNPDTGKSWFVFADKLLGKIATHDTVEINGFVDDVPTGTNVFHGSIVQTPFVLDSGVAELESSATSELYVEVHKNGSQEASVTIGIGNTAGVAGGFPVTFEKGDKIKIIHNGGDDGTGLYYNIYGKVIL